MLYCVDCITVLSKHFNPFHTSSLFLLQPKKKKPRLESPKKKKPTKTATAKPKKEKKEKKDKPKKEKKKAAPKKKKGTS